MILLLPCEPFSPRRVDPDFVTEFEAARLVGFPWGGYRLQTEPAAYDEAHYLPLAYRHTVDHTSRSAWIEGDSPDDAWTQVARCFRSPFLTIDVARLEDGSWRILETGDGQVSGLPAGLDPGRFYAGLWDKSR